MLGGFRGTSIGKGQTLILARISENGLRLVLVCFFLQHVAAQTCGRKDKIQMTVMSFKSHDSASSSTPLPHFECYLGAGDEDAAVTAARPYNTRPPGHPRPVPIVDRTMISDLPANTAGYMISITHVSNNAFGAFTCIATMADREDTTIMTIFLHADAYVDPVNRQFTQTVNVGDGGVIIDMEWTSYEQGKDQHWRINGTDPPVVLDTEDYTEIRGRDASTRDNGLYECHRVEKRPEARHGLNRLIVRACSSGRWGPHGCTGICDNCYNGGVCDDETGRCICAPGFMGPNCLTACGPNMFGYSCEFRCDNGGSDDGCMGRLFCLVDPFGCRCNSGFMDLNCSEVCGPNTFGAGCLQDCHCQNEDSCNRFMGICDSGGCQDNWSGDNCQIPEVCPNGYYGSQCTEKCLCLGNATCDKTTGICPNTDCAVGSFLVLGSQACQECQAGYFGDSCTEECHCDSDACDRVTGECVGCCKHQWINQTQSRCQEGFIDATSSKVNPGAQMSVTCSVEELVQSTPTYGVSVSRSMEAVDQSGVSDDSYNITSALSPRTGFIHRNWTFTIDNAQPDDELYCVISNNGELIWLNVSLPLYELPVLSTPPELREKTMTSIAISWSAWNETTDVGDPPVVGYLVLRKNDSSVWHFTSPILSKLEYNITNLDKDTNYTFSVLAVREGERDEGPMGPMITVKTLCEVPTTTPTAIMATIIDLNQLNVTWQVEDDNITCSIGITGYTIYYKMDGSSEDPQILTNIAGSSMSAIINAALLEPGKNYVFMVSLTTDQESSLSQASMPVIFPTSSSTSQPDETLILVFITIPAAVVLSLIILVVTLLFYRRRQRNKSSPADPPAITNNITIDNNEKEIEDKVIETIPIDKGGIIEAPTRYHEQPSGDQCEEYEVPLDQKGKVRISYGYEAVGFSKSELSRTPRRSAEIGVKEDTDPTEIGTRNDGIEQGVYSNVPTKRKTTPPIPIKVSEFQEFMKRDRRTVIGDIVNEFMALPMGRQHSCSEALQHERLTAQKHSSAIMPYDHSRVRLQVDRKTTQSDYYNASIVKGPQGKGTFIAAKEPLSRSLAEDFWRMIWEQDVTTVVMLTNSSDAEVSYWPKKVATTEEFGEVTVILQVSTIHGTYTTRKLRAFTNDDDHKFLTVNQFELHGWPRGGVPEDYTNLINFINLVKMRQEENKMAPLLVHCRNGSGVTGTFIALYQLMDVIKGNNTISVFNVICNMRNDRMDMVLTRLQYLYIYETLQQAQLTPEKTRTSAEDLKDMDEQTFKQKSDQEFTALRKIKELNTPPHAQMGEAHENVLKNRFPEIIPLDVYRPILKSKGLTFGSNDYINATKLQDDGTIILTQDPLASILEDFWRLVYEYKCSTIIMISDVNTADKNAAKYWPDSGRITHGSITIKCINTRSEGHFRTQQFEVTHQDHQQPLIVKHLTVELVKRDDATLAKMVDFIKFTGNISTGPTVIHCINGVGLSAVYVIVKTQIDSLEKVGSCDVFVAVERLRKKNTNFILTKNDYTLCLKLLRSYLNDEEEYSVID